MRFRDTEINRYTDKQMRYRDTEIK